jgi:predicted acyltransferase (DUF342 family)
MSRFSHPSPSGEVVVTPEEYIKRSLSFGPDSRIPVVEGDLDLRKTALGRSVIYLPPATIKGNVTADDSCRLREISCTVGGNVDLDASHVEKTSPSFAVTGGFSARLCFNLKSLSGFFASETDLSWSGIEELTPEFKCAGSVDLEYCKQLRKINCQIGGDLCLAFSGVEYFGKQCSINGAVNLEKCLKLKTLTCIGTPSSLLFLDSSIETIEENFACSGLVKVENCSKLKTVRGRYGSLFIRQSSVKSVESVICQNFVKIENCPALRGMKIKNATEISVSSCPSLRSLTPPARPFHCIRLTDCIGLKVLKGTFNSQVILDSLPNLSGLDPSFVVCGDFMAGSCPKLSILSGFFKGNVKLGRDMRSVNFPPSTKIEGDLRIDALPFRIVSHTNPHPPLPTPSQTKLSCSVGGDIEVSGVEMFVTENSFRSRGNVVLLKCGSIPRLKGVIGGNLKISESAIGLLGADLEIKGSLMCVQVTGDFTINCWVGETYEIIRSDKGRMGPVVSPPIRPDKNAVLV